jgi:hypothetical protein
MCRRFFPSNIPVPGMDIIVNTSYFQKNINIRHLRSKSNNNTFIEIIDALQAQVIGWSMDNKKD